ncbi:unnamed protein product [Spirodela intermedia]|uniref:RRM domain-containing protein n=1 Tax=Spirodela intermedia TaxID=51605 RepID=A0A7I8JF77_SPIIN|nr:unnamed protein product [Spirodela intermedia]CAA6668052.1 unnamed protein product [Spirodela intermedia]
MAGPPPPFALQGFHQWSQPPPAEAPLPPPHQQERFHGFPSSPAGPPESQVAASPPPSAPGLEVLSRLFSYYGATSVRPCVGGRLRNCAFVDFANEALASQAQSQLNRCCLSHGLLEIEISWEMLSVERAGKVMGDNNKPQQGEAPPLRSSSIQKDQPVTGKLTKDADMSSMPIAEPIAPRLGVDYPFPPYLEYEYPPPDGNILANIVNALIAVPRFYTQVLHLMNKMNIPAPFRMALPTPPIPPAAPPPPPRPLLSQSLIWRIYPMMNPSSIRRAKRVKREAIVGPAVDRGVSHEDVGLKPGNLVPKEVPMIKKKNPVLQFKIAPKTIRNENRGGDDTLLVTPEPEEQHLEPKSYAAAEEIERGKLPPEELLSLPMFKNYTPGNPAAVLYIKNLAKDVVVDDFYFIFGSLFSGVEETKSALNIKLMQEGRMRGQAFVTFPSTDLAQHALNLVNGFVFKGKPMVIQFGRNPSAAKPS